MSLIEFRVNGSRRAYPQEQWLNRNQWGKILGVPVETVKRITEKGAVRAERGEVRAGRATVITPVEDFPKLVSALLLLKSTSEQFPTLQMDSKIQVETPLGSTLIFPVEGRDVRNIRIGMGLARAWTNPQKRKEMEKKRASNGRSEATKERTRLAMRKYWQTSDAQSRKQDLSVKLRSDRWKEIRARKRKKKKLSLKSP